jgi:hypothetical protein
MDYSVINDGTGNQTPRLQKAIDDDGLGGTRKGQGVGRYPAQVYLPGGVYLLGSTLKLTVGTIIVGNPLNPPVLKAAKGFDGEYMIMGYDSHNGNPETSFAIVMKNVILDTSGLDPDRHFTALQWGVAQGSGLTNVQIRMPLVSTGHVGIDIKAGSTIAVTDVVSTPKTIATSCHLTNKHRILLAELSESRTPINRSISRTSLSNLVALVSLLRVAGQSFSNKPCSRAVERVLI